MKLILCAALVAMLGGCVAYYPHHDGYRDGHYSRDGHAGYYDRNGHYHRYDRDHYRGTYGY